MTITTPAPLAKIVHADEGGIWISTCAELLAPVGATVEAAVTNLPIREVGVDA